MLMQRDKTVLYCDNKQTIYQQILSIVPTYSIKMQA